MPPNARNVRQQAAAARMANLKAKTKLKAKAKARARRQLVFILDVPLMVSTGRVVIDAARRSKQGEGTLRPWRWTPMDHPPHDREHPAPGQSPHSSAPEAQESEEDSNHSFGAGIEDSPSSPPPSNTGFSAEIAASAVAATVGDGGLHSHPSPPTAQSTSPNGGGDSSDDGPIVFQMPPDPEDHGLLLELVRAQDHPPKPGARGRFALDPTEHADLIERICRTGRARLRRAEGETEPPAVRWDDGPPWRFALDVRADVGGKRWSWRGIFRRGDHRIDLAEPMAVLSNLFILGTGRVARYEDAGASLWVKRLRSERELTISDSQHDAELAKILGQVQCAPGEILESIQLQAVDVTPRSCLILRTPRQNWGPDKLLAELEFDYGVLMIRFAQPGKVAVSTADGLAVRRDEQAEQQAIIRLFTLGFREAKDTRVEAGTMELPSKRMPEIAAELVGDGWRVEAEGQTIHPAGPFKFNVTSGIDWFELGGQVSFGDQEVALPEVLEAARRGESLITLGDGSLGVLPEEWLATYGPLAELGTAQDGNLRFGKAQAAVLDALIASHPGAKVDIGFTQARQALGKFEGVVALEAPAGFHGELRPYQCQGLGWLEYLQTFGFGGILADDMGLGKTVQVLALLQRRRSRRQSKGPSLIIVPRSLVFNWHQEAARFTPRLRVLDYTGANRAPSRERFDQFDLIITTYGILRSDVAELSQREFDYVILDEAQAIKNSESQSAKAAHLLRSRQRLAITGTPIENHLGELWSIMDFLNPGMLGASSIFRRYAGVTASSSSASLTSLGSGAATPPEPPNAPTNGHSTTKVPDETSRAALARALRPFILRRTKKQVVDDLPEKTEQILYCEMDTAQRALYDQVRERVRQTLLTKGTGATTSRSPIEVLEALLRLRQAACHPGLIDPTHAGEASAKLDMLLPQLAEVVEEGHKVLIFSQFTKFLAIVKDRLDREQLTYEYLDGRTRNRAERVERFQTDPDCPIFLISLKAGGLGLNLTAAEYVYLLDPWWNPAVEAQAIDRSHRIGQTRSVFAYRLICRDTVEQKVLELQNRKRALFDAILAEDNRMIANLSRDDLEYLLS